MPSRPRETMPSTMKLTMTIVAKTGRLIDVSEIHMTALVYQLSAFGNAADLRTGGELASRIGEHRVARGEAFDNLHTGAVGEPFDHLDHRHRIALHLLHDSFAVARGDGLFRNQDDARSRRFSDARGRVHA